MREASGAFKYPIGDGQHGGQEERGGSVQKRLLGMILQQKDRGFRTSTLSAGYQNKSRGATKNGIKA